MTHPKMDIQYNRNLDALTQVLEGVDRAGDFFAFGRVTAPMPRFEVEGVGLVSFPVPESQVRMLIQQAEQAPYGRGEETIVDSTIRKVWQITPDKVHLGGKTWSSTLDSILASTASNLGYTNKSVSAEFYKLLIYDAGGFFVPHRDTEKAHGMFGTLVISLPSVHVGGELVIEHGARKETVDLSQADVDEISYAAFYADCRHEVKPIRSGYRVCLVYNLIQKKSKSGAAELNAPDYSKESSQAAGVLKNYFERKDGPPKIAWLLEHQYSPEGLCFSELKGADAARGRLLVEAAQSTDCAVHLGIVHIEESGVAEVGYQPYSRGRRWNRYDDDDDEVQMDYSDSFEIVEAYDWNQWIGDWVSVDDQPVLFGAIPLEEGELLPAGALDDEKPDQQRVSEATGNEGASYDRSYHRAAVVLWPRERYGEVLLQAGVRAVVPYLRMEIEKWRANPNPSKRSKEWKKIAALAERVSEDWNQDSRFRYLTSAMNQPKAERSDMMSALVELGDPGLLQRFIEGIVVSEFDGSENQALIAAAPLLGKSKAADGVRKLMASNIGRTPMACVELLEDLTRAVNEKDWTGYRHLRQEAAKSLVNVLPKTEWPKCPAFGFVDHWNYLSAREKVQAKTEAAPTGTAFIEKLLSVLRSMKEERLAADAASNIAANPEIFIPDTMLLPALSSATGKDFDSSMRPVFESLWKHAAEFLLKRSEHPPKPPKDWAQKVRIQCKCEDCRELQAFAIDADETVHSFRIKAERRSHLHGTIQKYDMDMTHVTERRGSPHTMVCTKTRRHFQNRCEQYRKDLGHFKTLIQLSKGLADHCDEISARLNKALDRR